MLSGWYQTGTRSGSIQGGRRLGSTHGHDDAAMGHARLQSLCQLSLGLLDHIHLTRRSQAVIGEGLASIYRDYARWRLLESEIGGPPSCH